MKSVKLNPLMESVIKCQERALRRLRIKYEETPTFYNVKVINDIIFNEESHFVALFKEYLLFEEVNEFLKKFYCRSDSSYKIHCILKFYEKYSKIYPNYIQLPQSKFIYKNIKRKQKMIDNMRNDSEAKEKGVSSDESDCSEIFHSKIMRSINNVTHSEQLYQESINNDNWHHPNEANQVFLDAEDSQEGLNSIVTVLDRITKAEKEKEMKEKEVIAVKMKSIEKSNIISPALKPKAIDIQARLIEVNAIKQQAKPPQKNKLLIGESLKAKFEKMLLTTNAGSNLRSNGSKTKRIVSFSPAKHITGVATARSIKQDRMLPNYKISNNNKVINAYYNNSNNINQRKHSKYATTNSSSLTATHISPLVKSRINSPRNSKLCSPRNSVLLSPHTQNNSLERKSLSIPKNNSNANLVNNVNVNIINHIQPGSTQINIYNGNILLKSLKLSEKSAIRSSSLQNVHKEQKKFKPKFDLNLKKILHKNIIEGESITDRNCRINFFEKEGLNIFNNEGKVLTKVSKVGPSESKVSSQFKPKNSNNNSIGHNSNMERQVSLTKIKDVICKSTHNPPIDNNCTNNRPYSRIKLKDLYDMNIFMKNNSSNNEKSSALLSERNKMKKLNFQ